MFKVFKLKKQSDPLPLPREQQPDKYWEGVQNSRLIYI